MNVAQRAAWSYIAMENDMCWRGRTLTAKNKAINTYSVTTNHSPTKRTRVTLPKPGGSAIWMEAMLAGKRHNLAKRRFLTDRARAVLLALLNCIDLKTIDYLQDPIQFLNASIHDRPHSTENIFHQFFGS